MLSDTTLSWARTFFRKKVAIAVLSLALIGGLGWVDYATGNEVAISAFYLIPICWACWSAGRKAGILLAGASAVVWLIADAMTGYAYPNRVVPYWNALMLLVLFVVVVVVLSAFERAHRHLEEVVQERTAALQAEIAERKRLEIGKLQTERLAVVGTMAAELAHEVRNPLGSIALNLDLITKEVDSLAVTSGHPSGESRLLVNEMREEVRRIQRVLEDYLQFARLPKPRRRSVALNEFLEQKLAFMREEFDQAKVTLRTNLDSAMVIVNTDGEQLWQATLNLIRNSFEAMPDGGGLVVSTRRDGKQAILRITDTGKGMTEEQLGQIFVPFYTTKMRGTGLGLAIVQQIVTEHGGHVECESVSGKGSTFTMVLPLAKGS